MSTHSAGGSARILVLYNPVCGHGLARTLFNDTVIPLLRQHGQEPAKIVETTHVGHAGEVLIHFLKEADGPVEVVLGSGDGTLHEIVCALDQHAPSAQGRELNFVLVPCGTANALYASLFPQIATDIESDQAKLMSLRVSLGVSSSASTRSLTLARTTLTSLANDSNARPSTSISVVVASTSLHASILHDSEALRATHPGIERFKIAAQQNITRWYDARVKLLPASANTPVQIYDSALREFVPYVTPDSASNSDAVQLNGPFAYFLSTVNVDRLEPAFLITPLHATLPPAARPHPATLDIVILRPLRDQTLEAASDTDKEAFAARCMSVLGGAYRDGAHVNMRFSSADGSVVEGGEGTPVVEYFRCGGWEWIPVSRLFYYSVDQVF